MSSFVSLLELEFPSGWATTRTTARTAEVGVAFKTVEYGWPVISTETTTSVLTGKQAWFSELVLVDHAKGLANEVAHGVGPRRQVMALD